MPPLRDIYESASPTFCVRRRFLSPHFSSTGSRLALINTSASRWCLLPLGLHERHSAIERDDDHAVTRSAVSFAVVLFLEKRDRASCPQRAFVTPGRAVSFLVSHRVSQISTVGGQ